MHPKFINLKTWHFFSKHASHQLIHEGISSNRLISFHLTKQKSNLEACHLQLAANDVSRSNPCFSFSLKRTHFSFPKHCFSLNTADSLSTGGIVRWLWTSMIHFRKFWCQIQHKAVFVGVSRWKVSNIKVIQAEQMGLRQNTKKYTSLPNSTFMQNFHLTVMLILTYLLYYNRKYK